MRALFYYAVAGHSKVAPALMGQVGAALRPFQRFLGQAIHTAMQRQVRYRLPWERVLDLFSVRLLAVDTLLRVPRRKPGLLIENWPGDKEADIGKLGFLIERGEPVRVVSAVRGERGLLVRTEPELSVSDKLIWCEVMCRLAMEEEPGPPGKVVDKEGNVLRVRRVDVRGDGEFWVLAVEGVRGDGELWVDGEEVEAQVVSPLEALRWVKDGAGQRFDVSGGLIRVEALPSDEVLEGEDGVRYRWKDEGKGGRRGHWVQLLPPEEEGEGNEYLDPRAAFCEGELDEVWTAPRKSEGDVFKVKRVDSDRYQILLDRLPPQGMPLFLPVDLRNLYLQKRALRQLSEAPLPHHAGLLRLCEDPAKVRWPGVMRSRCSEWFELRDGERSGTLEQREFVEKALGSPDFAFLEGPPGSGKTTAICELLRQLVARGERVLLCASTHVAIDNVLERLLEADSRIDAVRVGKVDRVDDQVQRVHLDKRVEAMVEGWRKLPSMGGFGDGELREMAERSVMMGANLTCGTTMGIVNHPLFRGRDEDLKRGERPISTMPHWDVLIVDEASKTLIQEFMVPALMARRWIIVGDVRQLPPFADREDIVANLRDLVDEYDRALFGRDHQRACLLLFRLLREDVRQRGMRWLLVEPPGVFAWMEKELSRRGDVGDLTVVRVGARGGEKSFGVVKVGVEEVRRGALGALYMAGADWVLVDQDVLGELSGYLPSHLLLLKEVKGKVGGIGERESFWFRQGYWLSRAGKLSRAYYERKVQKKEVAVFGESEACEMEWLMRNDWAGELAWRLTRVHELRRSHEQRAVKRLREEMNGLKPAAVDISERIGEIQDIGLPSILEVLQEGIGEDRSSRRSALTLGMRLYNGRDFAARFGKLTFQHRMHPDIAAFSREHFYEGASLQDANTIAIRDRGLGFDFNAFASRRVWADVDGREEGGENWDEVGVIAGVLKEFIGWARKAGPPGRKGRELWEVACLCFYVKQERALSEMLSRLTGKESKTRFRVGDAPVEIVCGTVDRFQGREADMVMLSMRNTRRVGFLDSPNRLNVALTRARQQLVVVGRASYFEGCGIYELEALAKRTPRVSVQSVQRWRRAFR